jgi:hypothetical protein
MSPAEIRTQTRFPNRTLIDQISTSGVGIGPIVKNLGRRVSSMLAQSARQDAPGNPSFVIFNHEEIVPFRSVFRSGDAARKWTFSISAGDMAEKKWASALRAVVGGW